MPRKKKTEVTDSYVLICNKILGADSNISRLLNLKEILVSKFESLSDEKKNAILSKEDLNPIMTKDELVNSIEKTKLLENRIKNFLK